MTNELSTQHFLTIEEDGDYAWPVDLRGPFDTVREAQEYARAFREENGIPGHDNVEPTPEENEAWTDAGWHFAIIQPSK